MAVKQKEYSDENCGDQAAYPYSAHIKDTLRATVSAPSGAAFANAVREIMTGFDVREGNGRLKNNLLSPKHTPPNMLINVVVRCPGSVPVTAEVQIILTSIRDLIEHRLYEVCRAPSPEALMKEAQVALKMAQRTGPGLSGGFDAFRKLTNTAQQIHRIRAKSVSAGGQSTDPESQNLPRPPGRAMVSVMPFDKRINRLRSDLSDFSVGPMDGQRLRTPSFDP
jgi:hypothetical protein